MLFIEAMPIPPLPIGFMAAMPPIELLGVPKADGWPKLLVDEAPKAEGWPNVLEAPKLDELVLRCGAPGGGGRLKPLGVLLLLEGGGASAKDDRFEDCIGGRCCWLMLRLDMDDMGGDIGVLEEAQGLATAGVGAADAQGLAAVEVWGLAIVEEEPIVGCIGCEN